MKLKKIIKGNIDFFRLLQEQSEYIVQSAEALAAYTQTLKPDYAQKVEALEKQADAKRAELIRELNKTFITPFDREDIFMLSKCLDDVLDYFKTTVLEMEIYKIDYAPELVKFMDVLNTASGDINQSVRNMHHSPATAMQYAVKAKKCENQVEFLYRSSVASLLENDDIKYIIKMRELYRHLSNCADRIDQAADSICHILMKEIS
ncbi:MAG: DUF47 family protein [Oscillospiraceae bacterium]|jgi:predicted phosphate transport protein (TIGR00153 family)|nr:DUF47 family protein [Oscillospiraceae bacterium]